MAKKAKRIEVKFNQEKGKYDRISEKAPKGKRRIGQDQTGKVHLYDDKGNIIASQG